MVTAIRSMKGTRLMAASSGFLPPLPTCAEIHSASHRRLAF